MAKARTWAPKQFFGGWGWGEFAKKMGLYFLRFRVAQNLELMTF